MLIPKIRRPHAAIFAALACAALLAVPTAFAQEGELPYIEWIDGPAVGQLGRHAEIDVPAGYRFTEGEGTRTFLELLENPPSGRELGMLVPSDGDEFWFVIFEFDAIGYVKDDEKDDLDADGIIESIRQGTAEANKIRAENGWGTVDVVGWERTPAYNDGTHNLEWAIRGRSSDGDSINYSTRLLGRRGVMSADLVLAPEQLPMVAPDYQSILAGFRFSTGESYAEFTAGDKIAAYGLTALVAGGAGALAAKSGLLARFWKFIVGGVLAVLAFFRRLFGRGEKSTSTEAGEPPTYG